MSLSHLPGPRACHQRRLVLWQCLFFCLQASPSRKPSLSSALSSMFRQRQLLVQRCGHLRSPLTQPSSSPSSKSSLRNAPSFFSFDVQAVCTAFERARHLRRLPRASATSTIGPASSPSSSPLSKSYLSSAPSSALTSEPSTGPSSKLATCVVYGVDSANVWSNMFTFAFSL